MSRIQHILHFLANKKLNELYISIAIKSFALSMISIFIPIYLLKLNYPLIEVLIFYAVLNAAHALFVIPAAKISSKYGYKHTIFFSIPLLIVFYLALYTLEQFNWPIYLLAIIFGINNSLFWMGYHVNFSKFSSNEKRGTELGVARIVSSTFHILGPVIGGIILTALGFESLFVTVCALLIASAIPLFFSEDIYEPIEFRIRDIFRGQKIKNIFCFIGHGVEIGISSVIWPIFIFFTILNNFTILGLVSSISMFFSLIFVFIVARLSDIHRKLVLKIGSILNALVWGARFFVKTTFQVFLVNSLYGMSQTMIHLPFDAISYDKANKAGIVKFIIFREIIIQIGRVLLFIVMTFITTSLTSSFLFGSGASLMYLFF